MVGALGIQPRHGLSSCQVRWAGGWGCGGRYSRHGTGMLVITAGMKMAGMFKWAGHSLGIMVHQAWQAGS